MVMTTSRPAESSRSEAAARAPALANSARRSATTSYTVKSCPASRILRAIPWPIRPRPTKPTFMVVLLESSRQLSTHPFNFAADIVDDVARLEMLWKHIPGICLYFKLARKWGLFMKFQGFLESKPRGAESAQVVQEHGNVKMGSPLSRPRICLPGLKGI